jgi:predicted nucleic acid-binding protein
VEIYMQLRNPAVLGRPLSGPEAAAVCEQLRANPRWQHLDYDPEVSSQLWHWARSTESGFRRIIDARLALTLLHHDVTHFATANVKDFQEFAFERVWNPLDE